MVLLINNESENNIDKGYEDILEQPEIISGNQNYAHLNSRSLSSKRVYQDSPIRASDQDSIVTESAQFHRTPPDLIFAELITGVSPLIAIELEDDNIDVEKGNYLEKSEIITRNQIDAHLRSRYGYWHELHGNDPHSSDEYGGVPPSTYQGPADEKIIPVKAWSDDHDQGGNQPVHYGPTATPPGPRSS